MSIMFLTTGISGPLRKDSDAQYKGGNKTAFNARITMPNGIVRTVKVQGVGCSEAICSRAFIRGKVDSHSTATVWFDRISTIKDVTENAALFVMKDGTERRVAFIPDFRVLYIANPNGGTEKLDLRTIQSLEMLPPAK
jgi:hypothetical protein